MITPEKMVQAGLADTATATRVAPALEEACQKYGIDSPRRVASFLAQCAHESCTFKATAENLNYSAELLLKIFPRYFNAASAPLFAHQPEKIANRAYSSRLGNGPEASGDGWKYRGRGFIQLTGKGRYAEIGKDFGVDFVANPDLLATPKYAALSAGWYWKTHNLNALADTPGIEDETRAINGGLNGLEGRQKLFDAAIKVAW